MAECNFPMIAVRMPKDGFNVAVIPFWPNIPRGVASPYRPLSDHILAVFHVELALPWRVAVLYMVEPGRHSRNTSYGLSGPRKLAPLANRLCASLLHLQLS